MHDRSSWSGSTTPTEASTVSRRHSCLKTTKDDTADHRRARGGAAAEPLGDGEARELVLHKERRVHLRPHPAARQRDEPEPVWIPEPREQDGPGGDEAAGHAHRRRKGVLPGHGDHHPLDRRGCHHPDRVGRVGDELLHRTGPEDRRPRPGQHRRQHKERQRHIPVGRLLSGHHTVVWRQHPEQSQRRTADWRRHGHRRHPPATLPLRAAQAHHRRTRIQPGPLHGEPAGGHPVQEPLYREHRLYSRICQDGTRLDGEGVPDRGGEAHRRGVRDRQPEQDLRHPAENAVLHGSHAVHHPQRRRRLPDGGGGRRFARGGVHIQRRELRPPRPPLDEAHEAAVRLPRDGHRLRLCQRGRYHLLGGRPEGGEARPLDRAPLYRRDPRGKHHQPRTTDRDPQISYRDRPVPRPRPREHLLYTGAEDHTRADGPAGEVRHGSDRPGRQRRLPELRGRQ